MEPCAANDRGIDSSAVGRENAVGEASKQTFLCPDSNKENVCGVEDASVFEPVLLSSHGKELTNTRAAPVRGVLASLSNSNHETAAMTESSFPTVASIAGGKVSFLKHRTSSMYKKPIESKQENMSDETPDSLAACSKKASTKNVSFVPIATRSQQKQRNPLQCRGKELSRITPSPGKLLLFPDGKLASPGLSYSPKSSAAAVFQSPPPTTLRRSSPPSSTSSTSSYASKPMGGVLANIPMEEGANALNLRVVVSDEAMGFPLVLDAMLTEATMRQSHAVYWSHNGEAFVVDCNQVEELEELLLKYFKRKSM